jgi:hypothetical protein
MLGVSAARNGDDGPVWTMRREYYLKRQMFDNVTGFL